jgi:1-acyl-sn-glycerol-3-phosphate acyltransferase
VINERWLVWKTVQTGARVLGTVLFDLKVYGLHHIPRHGGALIASNHQSYLDPILYNTHLRRPLCYLAKAELFEGNGFLAWLLRSVGAFPVRQGCGDVTAVRQSIQRLREGYLLNIYPEGSRTLDGRIGRIEKGIALIDRRAHVPVIPAVIVGAYEAWPWNRSYPKPWPIRIHFGSPMELANLGSDEIVTTVDHTLKSMFDELTDSSRQHSRSQHHLYRHYSYAARN